MKVFNSFLDFNLIKFPITFPLVYFFLLYFFPNYESLIIIGTILLLAETHFGATWPFLFNKKNFQFFISKYINFFLVPVLIIFSSILGFFYFNSLFLLFFFAANVHHVTKQSIGICKFYKKENSEFLFQENLIIFYGFLFFTIAFLRFYLQLNWININILIISIIILLVLNSILYIYLYKLTSNFFCFLTGSIIFFPVCFVENPTHVILMGVTMHYSQYLAMTFKITKARKIKTKKENKKRIFYYDFININFLIFIFTYSAFMSYLSFYSKGEINPNFILIPIIGQFLHFYLDSQLWKFSIKHNLENVFKNLIYKFKN
tara:strand:- start:57 stop:1010 length:954 start_codon:yes stop_codon:yes gene_type:complete